MWIARDHRRRLSTGFHLAALALAALASQSAAAGTQQYAPLSASVRALLHRAVSGGDDWRISFDSAREGRAWLTDMSRRLEKTMPDATGRRRFLKTVHYEAARAGLNPQLVLGLIQVESRFNKYALSRAGARGYMQVMPFWVKLIGAPHQDLFHLRTNLRYGCTILRYYLDREKGNLFRALGRYNGSLGQADYPAKVVRAWHTRWRYPAPRAANARITPSFKAH